MASFASARVWKTVRQTSSDFKVLKKVSTTAIEAVSFPGHRDLKAMFLQLGLISRGAILAATEAGSGRLMMVSGI
jgi:hypothetical protein